MIINCLVLHGVPTALRIGRGAAEEQQRHGHVATRQLSEAQQGAAAHGRVSGAEPLHQLGHNLQKRSLKLTVTTWMQVVDMLYYT